MRVCCLRSTTSPPPPSRPTAASSRPTMRRRPWTTAGAARRSARSQRVRAALPACLQADGGVLRARRTVIGIICKDGVVLVRRHVFGRRWTLVA